MSGQSDQPEKERSGKLVETASRAAEFATAAFLIAAGLAGVGFVLIYISGNNNQLLGLTLGATLLFAGTALVIASRDLVNTAPAEEERATFSRVPGEDEPGTGAAGAIDPERPDARAARQAEDEAADEVESAVSGSSRITRRKLLIVAGGVAGAGAGAAALTPLASIGPAVGSLLNQPIWAEGVRLLDENRLPAKAADLEIGSFLTAWADGADRKVPDSAVVVVRVKPEEVDLPAERADWAPEGLLAFSKVCTHAGCAVSLFRYPLFADRSPAPALVCPCHYSTFDVRTGGERIFGPAVRSLPQLPLRITDAGELIAAGPLSGPPGPSRSGMPKT